jgi:hypothetical protein
MSIAGSALTALVATPALAAEISAADCAAQSGTVSVRAVAVSPGETITLQQTLDGTFQGVGVVEVYCRNRAGTNLGDIPDSKVKITINPTSPGVTAGMFVITGENGVPATDISSSSPGNPVQLGPFSGTATFRITAPSTLLAPGIAAEDVAVDFQVVSSAWDGSLLDPATGKILQPGTFGDVLAQTPELDSLALFGTGALGILGYGITRMRAARRRDS